MTGFELLYRRLLPFEHPLYRVVNAVLREKTRCFPFRPRLLAVGGRSSNYCMHRWSVRQPVRTLGSFYGTWRNARAHRPQDIAGTSEGNLHLFGVVTC
jgi:hypothetical protein